MRPPRRLAWLTGAVAVVLAAATAYGAARVRLRPPAEEPEPLAQLAPRANVTVSSSRASPANPPSVPERASDGVRVIVYTTSWCSVCKRAKQWLSAKQIPFEEHDVERSIESGRTMRAINPRGSVPTFDIEGQVLVGFREGDLLAAMRRASERRSSRVPW